MAASLITAEVDASLSPEADEHLTVFRYTLKPVRAAQYTLVAQTLGCQRWVYNQGVALQEARIEEGASRLPYKDLCAVLVEWKHEHDWLTVPPAQTLQQTLSHLIRGYQAWCQDPGQFGQPKFKKRSQRKESLVFPTPAHINWNPAAGRVTLPKLGTLRYFKDKRVPDGVLRRVVLSRDGNDLVVSFLVKHDSRCVRNPAELATACGIDFGITNRIALDNGTVFAFPEDDVAVVETKIKTVQKWVSHKHEMCKQHRAKLTQAVKSCTISKAEREALQAQLDLKGESKTLVALRAKLRRLHQRRRFLLNNARHQATAQIARTYGTVCVEDLNTKAMTASAKGTVEAPGKNVRQKAGLNRQLLITAPGEIRRQLAEKVRRHGGRLIAVRPAYSSQTCPDCDHCEAANRPTRDLFRCGACAFTAPADQVGALNIKRWGLSGQHLAIIKPKKTRPPLLSRKPRNDLQDTAIPANTISLAHASG